MEIPKSDIFIPMLFFLPLMTVLQMFFALCSMNEILKK